MDIEPKKHLHFSQELINGSSSSLNASQQNYTSTITLKNNSEKSILFRIQTTSPMIYRVRPSHGKLTPHSSLTITVLHIGSTLPRETGKVDKFLIKYGSTILPEPDFNTLVC